MSADRSGVERLQGDLAALGIALACAEARDRLVVLRSAEGASVAFDQVSRGSVVKAARAAGFTHVAWEIPTE